MQALKQLATQYLQHHARYEATLGVLCQVGSKGAASAVRNKAAVQAAQTALTRSAAQYTALRGAASVVNPLLWAWYVGVWCVCLGIVRVVPTVATRRCGVDLLMLSLGSDYQRVVQAVFEIAQVRLLRTYGFVDAEYGGELTPNQQL